MGVGAELASTCVLSSYKSSRSLSHLLMSSWFSRCGTHCIFCNCVLVPVYCQHCVVIILSSKEGTVVQ